MNASRLPSIFPLIFFATVLGSVAPFAVAQSETGGSFDLVLENDIFAQTDRHYTSGLLVSYSTDPLATSWETRELAAKLPGVSVRDVIFASYHLGHQAFTPENIETDQLVIDERPYAAYLFGGLSVVAGNERGLSAWTLNVGLIGPDARGEQLQTSIHSRTGSTSTRGWQHQLGNEMVVQLDHEQVWRRPWMQFDDGLSVDISPYVGFGLGNAAVHLDAGLNFRLGRGLEGERGAFRLRPSMPGSNLFHSERGWGWYSFVGFGLRHVAHNVFLDGNANGDSHKVAKRSWVGDLQCGLVFNAGIHRLAFTFVLRSPEYRTQKSADRFGSLTLSIDL